MNVTYNQLMLNCFSHFRGLLHAKHVDAQLSNATYYSIVAWQFIVDRRLTATIG